MDTNKNKNKKKLNLPYTGIASFCKYPICTDLEKLDADAAIIGVPYDMGTQYRSGTKMGPRGIRDGSTIYAFGLNGSYDHEKDVTYLGNDVKIVDCGDVDMIHGDLDQSFDNIRETVRTIAEKGSLPVVLGGDHSISIPVVEGLESKGPFCVVQFDAHLDFCDERLGQRYGHGSPMRRFSEMSHVTGLAHLGIRGIGSSIKSDFDDARAYGSVIISPRQFRKLGLEKVMEAIPSSPRYFVSIDIDGMDPSIAPGTGTPSPGGFNYHEMQDCLEALAAKGEIVGFDLVEVAPMYDQTGLTNQVAARVILDFLGYIFKEREKGGANHG